MRKPRVSVMLLVLFASACRGTIGHESGGLGEHLRERDHDRGGGQSGEHGLKHGMRLLDLLVTREGQVIAYTMFAVPESCDVDAMWAAAGRRPLAGRLIRDSFKAGEYVGMTRQEPLYAQLKGVIRLSLKQGYSLQSEVTLDGVRMIRMDDDDNGAWRLSAGDVARARKAAVR